MTLSLRVKLSLTFMFVTLISVFMISIMANFLLEKQFRQYIVQKLEAENKEIVSLISQQYDEKSKWKTDVIENIGVTALEKGLIVKVKDTSGKTIWDATQHNSGMCEQMLANMSKNMLSRYPNWQGGYIENKYPAISSLNEVGTIEIGYYGPFYYNDSDLYFINTLNNALIWIGLISLFLSLLLGVLFSKRLSTPIIKVIETAKLIAKGDFKQKSNDKSSTKEIQELITTINDLAESLETHEKLRKQLTTDVAHELRTPMATLQSHMEAMMDGIWQPTEDRLKSCHEEIIRVNKMIGDLSLLAKFEGQNLMLNKTNFNITVLVASVVMNFESEFANKGVNIHYVGEAETIFADRDKTTQVLINLLSNSLKYTPPDGAVEIIVAGKEDAVEITVRDNGQGIPEEDLPHIFERFYRADKSRNRLTGGAGIGLTIVKSIIDAHHGAIQVQSKATVGSAFIISLPRH